MKPKEYSELTEEQVRLVEDNLRLAWSFAHKFKRLNPSVSLQDLIGAANIGLVIAARTYEKRRGSTFSTYAVPIIKQRMLRYCINSEKKYRELVQCSSQILIGEDSDDTLEELQPCQSLLPSEIVLADLFGEEIEKFINNLPTGEKDVTTMKLLGYSDIKIAETRGTSRQAVHIILKRVRRKFEFFERSLK